jgi:hypothetical protein
MPPTRAGFAELAALFDEIRVRSCPSSSPCELIAERAGRGTLHHGLVTREADLATAGRGDIEIGLADQQSPEFRLAERAKELREPAVGDIELQRFLIVSPPLPPAR